MARTGELARIANGYQVAVRNMLDYLTIKKDYEELSTVYDKRMLLMMRVRTLVQQVNCGHRNSRYVLDPVVQLLNITHRQRLDSPPEVAAAVTSMLQVMYTTDSDKYVSAFVDMLIAFMDRQQPEPTTAKSGLRKSS